MDEQKFDVFFIFEKIANLEPSTFFFFESVGNLQNWNWLAVIFK
jgi:hypothetical protein